MKNKRQPILSFLMGFVSVLVVTGVMAAPESTRAIAARIANLCYGTGVSNVSVARYGVGAGRATFGLALPQGAAMGGVKLGAFPTQTDIKKTWSDGSIRFAIVSADVTNGGTYDVFPDVHVPGAYAPTWPQVSVDFTIGGQAYTASLPALTNADPWLSGPVVHESRAIVVPSSGGQQHPLLRVIFDVRSYAAGGQRVDIAVDNVKDIAAGNSVAYDVAVRVGNSVAYQRSGVQHAYLTRWRKTVVANNLVESAVTPDFEPFHLSGYVPRFLSTVANASYPSLTGTKYDILDFGDLSRYMGQAGGRPEIAPLPYWTAQYIVHKNASQRAYLMKHADLSGSWSGHISNPDGSSIKITDRPMYWLDGRGPQSGADGPKASSGGSIIGGTDFLENAHIPSLNFIPYMITGDRWHLDQMKYWADFAVLWTWPWDGNWPRTGGLLNQNQIRGIGWGLRLIAEAAASAPDNDPAGAYFSSIAQTNVSWLDNYAATNVAPGGFPEILFWRDKGVPGVPSVPMWMLSYVSYAVYHAQQLGFSTNNKFIDRVAKFQVRLFNSTAEGLPPTHAAPYYLVFGNGTSPNFNMFNTLAEVYAATFPSGVQAQPYAGYLGPETAMLLKFGVKRGIPNSSSALSWLMSQNGVAADLNARSGFAVDIK
jgi:hypothetical protein